MSEKESGSATSGPPEDKADDTGDSTWTDSLFGASESIRGAISGTIRNVLNNDEGIRKLIRDALPKEVVGHVTRTVDQGKDEIVRAVGQQTRKFLENIDLGQEIQNILTSVSLEFRTELRFIPNDQAVKPEGRVTMKVKQGEKEVESKSIPIPTGLIRDAIMNSLTALSAAFQKAEDMPLDGAENEGEGEDVDPTEPPDEAGDSETP